jgi:hypothetical protein
MQRGLIIQKIWLDQIFDNGKIWEMRCAKTKITGKIGLIEAGTGQIVGDAILLGCLNTPIEPNSEYFDKHKINDFELLRKWKYPWILSNPKRYANPIPYNHPKGAVIWVRL